MRWASTASVFAGPVWCWRRNYERATMQPTRRWWPFGSGWEHEELAESCIQLRRPRGGLGRRTRRDTLIGAGISRPETAPGTDLWAHLPEPTPFGGTGE